jgi:hypothetical protein
MQMHPSWTKPKKLIAWRSQRFVSLRYFSSQANKRSIFQRRT